MDESLPIVTAALICERVLIEKDDVVSAIRIFDRLVYVPPPAGIEPGVARIPFMFLVMLKRGNAASRNHEISVAIKPPSGNESRAMPEPLKVEFAGEDPDAGVNLQIGIQLTPSEEGLYWIELMIDGQLSARTPFRLFQQDAKSPT